MPKRAIRNEFGHPYIVEVAVVGDELNVQLGRRIMQFHQSRRIQPRYGRTITTNRAKLYRWCFSDLLIARAFIEQFGGELYKHGNHGQRGEAAGAAEMSDLLQFVIVAGFGALCFGFGYLIAFIVTRNRWRDEMIKRGVARYNWKTGKWGWGEPPKERS